jgi:trimeric autotransporter adhesin
VAADKLAFPISATVTSGGPALALTTTNGTTALYGQSNSTSIGVWGRADLGTGVRGDGKTTASGQGGFFYGYVGAFGYSPSQVGVWGHSDGNWGVYGESASGYGVMGQSDRSIGVYGRSDTTTGFGGYFSNSGGIGNSRGVAVGGFTGAGSISDTHPGGEYWKAAGEFSGPNGLIGAASDVGGIGVVALNAQAGSALAASKSGGSGYSIEATNYGSGGVGYFYNGSSGGSPCMTVSNNGTGYGFNLTNYGSNHALYLYNSSAGTGMYLANYGSNRAMFLSNNSTNGATYFSQSSTGTGDAFVFSNNSNGDALNVYDNGSGSAVYVTNGGGGYAAYFSGNVWVNGTVSKSAGSFKIDHPLDPSRKYLQHSFVESPDMMNVYNGNVVTDASGDASVVLPEYFSSLNRDYRYQLTVIGQFAQAIVKDEISGNRFTIKTDKPNVKVSWQVTGIRRDPWANANRIEVEVMKAGKEQGKYLYPEGYGQPESSGLEYERVQAARAAASVQEIPPTREAPVIQAGQHTGSAQPVSPRHEIPQRPEDRRER